MGGDVELSAYQRGHVAAVDDGIEAILDDAIKQTGSDEPRRLAAFARGYLDTLRELLVQRLRLDALDDAGQLG